MESDDEFLVEKLNRDNENGIKNELFSKEATVDNTLIKELKKQVSTLLSENKDIIILLEKYEKALGLYEPARLTGNSWRRNYHNKELDKPLSNIRENIFLTDYHFGELGNLGRVFKHVSNFCAAMYTGGSISPKLFAPLCNFYSMSRFGADFSCFTGNYPFLENHSKGVFGNFMIGS
jgi:hypothetical protein